MQQLDTSVKLTEEDLSYGHWMYIERKHMIEQDQMQVSELRAMFYYSLYKVGTHVSIQPHKWNPISLLHYIL